MAAGPEALRMLLKDIEQLQVQWERVWQTLREQGLDKGVGWYSFSEAKFPWDDEFKQNIWERIDNWRK